MKLLPFLAMLAVAGGGLLVLRYLAPLQLPTVLFYAGVGMVVLGLATVIRTRISSRRFAVGKVLGGVALMIAGLLWPVQTQRSAAQEPLDRFLPVYDFDEEHEVRVHARPERVARAMREVTFADVHVMQNLMRVRNAVMGQFREPPPAPRSSIVQMISLGRTGFFPLFDTEGEFVFGLAGQPWNNGVRPVRLTPESFRAWMEPGNVKVAANLRVDDAGGGWSLLTTETRVQGTDDAARKTMARYWRIIYPGSGWIRRSLLESIRERAER